VVARSVANLVSGEAPADLLRALVEVAEARAAASDGPGTATVLDAIGLVFDLACPVPLVGDKVSYSIPREPTIALWHRLRALLGGLPRCSQPDGCPRCWDGRSCGRDEVAVRLAPAISNVRWSGGRMETTYSINHWLSSDRRQGWFSNRHDRTRHGGSVKGAFAGPELADATLGWMLRTFRVLGDSPDRDKIVSYQVGRVIQAGGCSDPAFWEMVALDFARSGREPDLVQAIAACDEGLRQKPPRDHWVCLGFAHADGRPHATTTGEGPTRARGETSPGPCGPTQARAPVRVAAARQLVVGVIELRRSLPQCAVPAATGRTLEPT